MDESRQRTIQWASATVMVHTWPATTEGYPEDESQVEQHETPICSVKPPENHGVWVSDAGGKEQKYRFEVRDIPQDDTVQLNIHTTAGDGSTENPPIDGGVQFSSDGDQYHHTTDEQVWFWVSTE